MNKAFFDGRTGKALVIRQVHSGVEIQIDDEHGYKTFVLPSLDSPRASLAILEAAGVEPVSGWIKAPLMGSPEQLAVIAQKLVLWVEASESHAKEQAELEAEALKLANEFYGTDWDFFPCSRTVELHQWLAVARRAREMRAEK